MKSTYRSMIILCVVIFLITSFSSTAQEGTSDAMTRFRAEYQTPGLNVIWDKQMDAPRSITGLAVAPPREMENPERKEIIAKIADFFLEKNRDLLNVSPQAVRLKKVWRYRDKWYATMKTTYEGIPIYRGQIGFSLDKQGKILTYSSDYNPNMELDIVPAISRERALEIAHEKHTPRIQLPVTPKDVYLMIYQERAVEGEAMYRLAWHIFLETEAGHPEVDRVFFIDAKTAEVIKDFAPHPSAISGTIQGESYPVHSTDAVTTVAFEHEEISVPGSSANTNASGSYSLTPGPGSHTLTTRLEGPYVQVRSYDSGTATDQDITHTAVVTDPGTHNFTWTSTNSAPDDGDGLNVFWQANRLHDDYYLAVLGINWTHWWSGTHQMRYSVNRGAINNAFAGNPITIYSDATARNSDIIFHETTHNVLYNMFGGSYVGWPAAFSEGYAFDEGFADYVACSFNNDSVVGENVIATRNCDNNMQYPGTTYNIEGHTGGQLISGIGWDLWNREGLNHNAVDVLLFAGLNEMATLASPYYFSNPNHSNYLTSLLIADDNNANISDGTPNDRQISQAFRNHDLLPVDVFSKDSPSDDGNAPSAGQQGTSPDIWVRNIQDGGTTHQDPKYNQVNYLYVTVRNLGYLEANAIDVKVYWADPAGGISWPADWNYIDESTVSNLGANSDTVIAPIPWTPTGTAIGQRSLLVRLESSQDMMTEEGNVTQENNIAQKNVDITPCILVDPASFDAVAPAVDTCVREPTTVTLRVPNATNDCGTAPVTVEGEVTLLNGIAPSIPIPVVGGTVTLPEGTHEITWIASDGTNSTTVTTTVTVNFDPTACCAVGSTVLNGNNLPNVLVPLNWFASYCVYARGGPDIVTTFSGGDYVVGGAGPDALNAGTGNDIVIGGTGPDQISGGVMGRLEAFGDDGPDVIVASGATSSEIHGGRGNDVITGGVGPDVIYPGPGVDVVTTDGGLDTIVIYDACEIQPLEVLNCGLGGGTIQSPVDPRNRGAIVTNCTLSITMPPRPDLANCPP